MKSFLTVILLAFPLLLFAEPVHISVSDFDEQKHGAGYSISKGRECFVVTPHHVVEKAAYDSIVVTDTSGRRGTAITINQFPDNDIALLKLKDNNAIKCGEKWRTPSGVGKALDEADFLLGIKQDGNGRRIRSRFFVASSSPGHLELSPYSARDAIERGDSGSTLYAGKLVVGMLLNVEPATGLGNAIPQDQLYGLLSSDMVGDRKTIVAISPVIEGRKENAYATMALRDMLNKSGNIQLVEASFDQQKNEPRVPEQAQYFIVTRIIDIDHERVDNENYERESGRESSSMKKLGDGLLGRNESERYFTKYIVDVETEIHNVESKTVIRNLKQQSVTIKKSRSEQTDKDATSSAVADVVKDTIKNSEYSNWVASNGGKIKLKNPFKGLFGRKKE